MTDYYSVRLYKLPKAVSFSEEIVRFSFSVSSDTSSGCLSVRMWPNVGETDTRGHAGAFVLWSVKGIMDLFPYMFTAEPLYNGHLGDRRKWPL